MIRGLRAGIVAASLAVLTCGCGAPPVQSAAAARAKEPRFEDAFDEPPDALFVVRPQAIKHDPLYGPLWQRVMRAALARGGSAVGGDRALEAIEGAESIVMGVSRDRDEAIVGLRGVPSGLEPARILDGQGQPMWQNLATNGAVVEYGPTASNKRASLFVLPGREWVFVLGEGARRAREGFAHPRGGPPIEGDGTGLAFLRVRGDVLVREVHALRSGLLASIGMHLGSLSLTLPPGAERSLAASFAYSDEPAAKGAEQGLRALIAAIADGGERTAKLAWLKGAVVDRDGTSVRVRSGLPLHLIEELPNAGSAPIDL